MSSPNSAWKRIIWGGMVVLAMVGLIWSGIVVFHTFPTRIYPSIMNSLDHREVLEGLPMKLDSLPNEPNAQDYVKLMFERLDQETGNKELSLTYLRWQTPCNTSVYTPGEIKLRAKWYDSFGGFYQEVIDVEMIWWIQDDSADIEIATTYVAKKDLRPFPPTLEINTLTNLMEEMHKLAEQEGGQVYRDATQNQCLTVLNMVPTTSLWLVEYQPTQDIDNFCAAFDPQTKTVMTATTTMNCKDWYWSIE